MEYVTVEEASIQLGTGTRTIQDRCKRGGIKKTNGTYLISKSIFNDWLQRKGLRSAKTSVETSVERVQKTSAVEPSDSVAELKQEIASLSDDIKRYREVLVGHGKMFSAINDRFNNVEKPPSASNDFKTEIKDLPTPLGLIKNKIEPEVLSDERKKLIQEKLENQFSVGTKHISVTKELPNEGSMNEVGFGTRLHHLNKLEDMYPLSKNIPLGEVETEVTTTKLNEDGSMKTTTEKTSTDYSK